MAKLRSLLAVFEAPMQVYKAEKQLIKRVWKDTVTIIRSKCSCTVRKQATENKR